MSAYDRLLELYLDLRALDVAQSMLGWDRQVMMPAGGSQSRGEHQARLGSLEHRLLTSDEFRTTLEKAEAEGAADEVQAANLRILRRRLDIQSKLPASLIERKAKIGNATYATWRTACPAGDFAAMVPGLTELFDIARETSEFLGGGQHVYDPLINQFEEGCTFADADNMFRTLKPRLVELIQRIAAADPIDDQPIAKDFDRPTLLDLMRRTVAQIGFDMNAGRLDLAPNAFCTNIGHGDTRMTTRASSHLRGIFSSSLHEMGHALYDQGSPKEWALMPLAGQTSLALHESQSRFWENIVGRSRGFWTWFTPHLHAAFCETSSFTADQLWRMINKVEPGFIRVGSDELTYNLHILIRFEIEVEILSRKLEVKDMPEAWNEKMRSYLGIVPPHAGLGCIQDVHWTRGSIGYFPTYSMGNMIGGRILQRLQAEFPNMDNDFAGGNFAGVLGWLQTNLYQKAQLKVPKEQILEVSGSPLETEAWLDYAETKFTDVYALA